MKQEQGDGPAKMLEGYEQLDLTGFDPEVKRTGKKTTRNSSIANAETFPVFLSLVLIRPKTGGDPGPCFHREPVWFGGRWPR